MIKFISENINLHNYLFIAIVGTFALIISISYSLTNDVFAQQNLTDNVNTNTNNQPNINAENVFNTKTMTSGGNIKDLVGKKGKVHMDGGKVYKFAVTEGRRLLREQLLRQGFTVENISWFLLHQANKRINDAILGEQGIGASPQKCPSTLELFGNTAGSSLGMLIAHTSKNFKHGDKMLLFAAGAGLTSAIMYMVWGKGAHSD